MNIITDVDYSGKGIAANQMDVFVPDKNESGIGLLFIHGGGWSGGKREGWQAVAKHFCALGYSCATMSYRLAPANQYPAQVEDTRMAMAYWKQHAEEYGFRPDAVVSIGSSAGGYLAAMLALIMPEDSIGTVPDHPLGDTRPMAAVLYCPVTDLGIDRQFVANFMGGTREERPALYREANPIERVGQVDLTNIPFLVIQGDKDETTTLENSRAFCDEIQKNGGRAEVAVLEGVGHGFGYGTESTAQKASIAHVEKFLQALE